MTEGFKSPNPHMKIEEHCKRSKKEFGDECKEVHKFLDQFSGHLGADHRKLLHNFWGIQLCGVKFGPMGMKAAYQHIVDDGECPDRDEMEV